MKINMNWQKVLTFICAIWPGGGYMYHGMMKKGALLMALFTAFLGMTLTVGWKFLAFLLPVIWCYCFFDTFHVARLTVKEREEEDSACFEKVMDFLRDDPLKKLEDKKTFLGVIILLAALYTMVYGVLLPFFRWGEQFAVVRTILTVIPTAVVAVLLFMVGRHVLQKEQDRKDALAEEWDEDDWDDEELFAEEIVDEDFFDPDEPVEMTGEILAEIGVETAEWVAEEAEETAEEGIEETEMETEEMEIVSEEAAEEESIEEVVEEIKSTEEAFQGIDIEIEETVEEKEAASEEAVTEAENTAEEIVADAAEETENALEEATETAEIEQKAPEKKESRFFRKKHRR